jgi:hypothetical protein
LNRTLLALCSTERLKHTTDLKRAERESSRPTSIPWKTEAKADPIADHVVALIGAAQFSRHDELSERMRPICNPTMVLPEVMTCLATVRLDAA